MGRSRGGLTTKIHALVDADGRPVKLILTPGQAGDAPVAATLLEDLAPGATLIADRAYDTNAIRELASERGAWANIPPRTIRKAASPSPAGSIASEIWSNASSTRSNSSAAWPHATTENPRTSSPLFNSLLSASGLQQYKSAP